MALATLHRAVALAMGALCEGGRLRVGCRDSPHSRPRRCIELSRAMADVVAATGLPFAWGMHAGRPTEPGEPRNRHFHLVFLERINDRIPRTPERWFRRANMKNPAAGGPKDRGLKAHEWLREVRGQWAGSVNEALERVGRPERVTAASHRRPSRPTERGDLARARQAQAARSRADRECVEPELNEHHQAAVCGRPRRWRRRRGRRHRGLPQRRRDTRLGRGDREAASSHPRYRGDRECLRPRSHLPGEAGALKAAYQEVRCVPVLGAAVAVGMVGDARAALDQAHRLMRLWRAGDEAKVNEYLDDYGLKRHALFARVLQAVIELSPSGSEERATLESVSNHISAIAGVAPARKAALPLGPAP